MSKVKSCVGKDSFQRMNYLYQASNAVLSPQNNTSVFYSNLLVKISKKAVQRIDPEIKRTICKGCHKLLIAGITAKVRVRKKHVYWICTLCNTSKVFKATTDYKIWTQQKDAIVEIIDYSKNC